jgi:flagellar biosynthesis/type III secretory pathway M-ring protein FliF/YscJ
VLLVAFLMYRRAAKQRRKRAELLAELQLDAGTRPALTAGSVAGGGAAGPAAGMAAGVQDYAPASLTAAGGTAAPVAVGGGVMAPARPALGTAVIDAGAQQRAATGVNIAQMADQQPDEVAHLMRGWLDDNPGGRS